MIFNTILANKYSRGIKIYDENSGQFELMYKVVRYVYQINKTMHVLYAQICHQCMRLYCIHVHISESQRTFICVSTRVLISAFDNTYLNTMATVRKKEKIN